jgi:hypothetical protein
MKRAKFSLQFVVCALTLLMARLACANLVTNGDFESGNLNGWSTGYFSYDVAVDSTHPHTGTYAVHFGDQPMGYDNVLFQYINTTPGDTYSFSFWLQNTDPSPLEGFSADWDGSQLLLEFGLPTSGYTQYTFTEEATTNSTVIGFWAATFTPDTYIYVDDVTATPIATPEPSTISLLAAGLAGLWVWGRKKFKRI